MIRYTALFIVTMLLFTKIVFAGVTISEIAWMGNQESQFGEWFELYNDSAEDVSLAGWKLYEGGGEQLVFTLTKTITSEGYLLVERTTASSPDPVPGINDESGPFGGSGFSNTGEHLVLKNSQGTIEQSLNFLSGWPAGDTTTKQTMQWNGLKWITATPTPKAPSSKITEDETETPKNNLGTAWSAPKSEPHIEILIPKNIYTKVSAEYNAKTFLEFGQAYNGIFLWNMGDGTVYKSNKPEVISHIYKYPGFYIISFAYYKNPYDKKSFLFNSVEKTVVNSQIDFKVVPDKGFEFTNLGAVPVDISGWYIQIPEKLIQLPEFTIIASKKTIIMPFSSFGLESKDYKNALLQTPQRTDIFGLVLEKQNTEPKKVLQASVYNSFEEPIEYIIENDAVVLEDSKKEDKNQNGNTKKIIFGSVLILVILMFILVEKKVKQE